MAQPAQKFVLKMKSVGGEPANMATLAPKLGPMGVSPKKVSDDIAAATKEYKSIKCMIELTIENRIVTVKFIPTSPTLILKALKEPPRDRKKKLKTSLTLEISLSKISTKSLELFVLTLLQKVSLVLSVKFWEPVEALDALLVE